MDDRMVAGAELPETEASATNSATGDRGQAFAELVHRLLTGSDRTDIEATARAMGMPYHTFYNRLRNTTPFSADEIRRLLAVLPDARLLHFLLEGTRFVPAERMNAVDAPEDVDIQRGAERIAIEAADVLRATYLALADRRIDHRDARVIRDEIDIAERALASLRQHLDMLLTQGAFSRRE